MIQGDCPMSSGVSPICEAHTNPAPFYVSFFPGITPFCYFQPPGRNACIRWLRCVRVTNEPHDPALPNQADGLHHAAALEVPSKNPKRPVLSLGKFILILCRNLIREGVNGVVSLQQRSNKQKQRTQKERCEAVSPAPPDRPTFA